jgi:hypothetical protein
VTLNVCASIRVKRLGSGRARIVGWGASRVDDHDQRQCGRWRKSTMSPLLSETIFIQFFKEAERSPCCPLLPQGACLYYKEWQRPLNSMADDPQVCACNASSHSQCS